MKISAYAFRIEIEGKLSNDAFFSHLVRESPLEFSHSNKDRILAVEELDRFFVGVLLSSRDQSTNLVITKNPKGQLVGKHQQITGGKPADFTYFLVSKKHYNGISTHYRSGGGVTQFGNLKKKQFNEFRDAQIKLEIQEATELEYEFDEPVIRRKFKDCKFDLKTIQTNPNFNTDLNRLEVIREFNYTIPTVTQPIFSSVSNEVKFEQHKLTFHASKKSTGSLRRAITSAVQTLNPMSGSAKGLNSDGLEDHVSINHEAFRIDSFNYDDYAKGVIQLSGLKRQPLMTELFRLAHAHPALF